MKTKEKCEIPSCPHAFDAAAWAAGKLHGAALVEFEAHMQACPDCAAEAAGFRKVVTQLRTAPVVEPSPDLTARILSALPPNAFRETRTRRVILFMRRAHWLPAAAAAAVALAVGGALILQQTPARSDSAQHAGCEWIARNQDADGTWDPAKVGGSALYRPALTALATLALAREPQQYQRQIDAACVALKKLQLADGGVGAEDSGRMYNHALATCALLTVYAQGRHPEWKDAIGNAVAFIRSRQQRDGGWGYRAAADDPANTAVTVWQVQALARADAQGWTDAGASLRKGLHWLQQRADNHGRFGYTAESATAQNTTAGSPTLDAMASCTLLNAGAAETELAATTSAALANLRAENVSPAAGTDFYRAFFTAAAWDAVGDTRRATTLRTAVCANRETGGINKGSWTPTGAYGAVGGRICATSLAVLTLRPGS